MARVLKPISVKSGVTITISGQNVSVKGPKGTMALDAHEAVTVKQEGEEIHFIPREEKKEDYALVGTTRALVNSLMVGVTDGFEKKLQLVGVGYRAQAKGKVLNLALGFSHPVDFDVPEGVTIETPSNTEVVVKGMDKQLVGQVAANIRAYRPPEPYKGKGIRYSDERVVRKEAKKK